MTEAVILILEFKENITKFDPPPTKQKKGSKALSFVKVFLIKFHIHRR